MKRLSSICILWAASMTFGQAQDFTPPDAVIPDAAVVEALQTRLTEFAKQIATLRRAGARDPGLADLEVYHSAVQSLLRHKEYYTKDYPTWANETLDRGMLRLKQLSAGEMPWIQSTGVSTIHGYRSRLDGSIQPFAVTRPATYGKDPKKWRLDVVLHGRNKTLTEVGFLRTHNGSKAAPADMGWVQIDVYGRGNNAYRWAGELDVLEAIENFFTIERLAGRETMLDPARIVLRGFSMGGAGSWHLGLHHPDRWCVVGPGAGFTTTHGYIKGLPNPLPEYQERCLRIYDALDYAENAYNVPIVAYSGGDDAQKLAADNIELSLQKLGIPMKHLVAPGLGHTFPPEWFKKANALWAPYGEEGKPSYPPHVKFVTYTMKYPTCYWVEILGLDKHYDRTLVDAKRTDDGVEVKTANVRTLHLKMPPFSNPPDFVTVDGQKVAVADGPSRAGLPGQIYLNKRDGKWQSILPQRIISDRLRRPQKVQGLQGPIDDAFTAPFLCVRGTGKSWHAEGGKYADENLIRFEAEWAKYFRGTLPIKDDDDVTPDDIANKHLILFGDPSSNSLIAQVLDGLPLTWTKDAIVLGDKKTASEGHVPVLIHPNPLNPHRYVVLNSGHTFHAPEYQGTNAQLYPRLGDYAILRLMPTERNPCGAEVVSAGLFDEFWK